MQNRIFYFYYLAKVFEMLTIKSYPLSSSETSQTSIASQECNSILVNSVSSEPNVPPSPLMGMFPKFLRIFFYASPKLIVV